MDTVTLLLIVLVAMHLWWYFYKPYTANCVFPTCALATVDPPNTDRSYVLHDMQPGSTIVYWRDTGALVGDLVGKSASTDCKDVGCAMADDNGMVTLKYSWKAPSTTLFFRIGKGNLLSGVKSITIYN